MKTVMPMQDDQGIYKYFSPDVKISMDQYIGASFNFGACMTSEIYMIIMCGFRCSHNPRGEAKHAEAGASDDGELLRWGQRVICT